MSEAPLTPETLSTLRQETEESRNARNAGAVTARAYAEAIARDLALTSEYALDDNARWREAKRRAKLRLGL